MGWGPGKSRVIDEKRHFEKPIELSPLVAIDRERCILCYRCVRFSQEVAEDEQLQLLERGDRTFVGTFDDRPYVAPFHGNITDLCPVGALTSYTYRFRARPWDIEQAGSVCTLCPSQCNVSFTVRDEKVKRVVARDNPEVDDGWLCDRGRYGFEMFDAEERVDGPRLQRRRRGRAGSEAIASGRRGRCGAAGAQGRGDRRRRLQRGGLPGPAASCARRSARRTSTRAPRAGPGREALRAARPAGDLGQGPRHRRGRRDPRPRHRPAAQLADPRPAHPQGDPPQRRQAGRRDRAPDRARRRRRGDRPLRARRGRRTSSPSWPRAIGGAENVATPASPRPCATPSKVVVVWGERIAREGRAPPRPCSTSPPPSTSPSTDGAGLLEIPDTDQRPRPARGRLPPRRRPGPAAETQPSAARSTEEIRDALSRGELKPPDPLRRRPAPRLPRHPGLGRGPRPPPTSSSPSRCFENATTAKADVVFPLETHAEKDGTVTHPDGRLQRVRPSASRPGDIRPELAASSQSSPRARPRHRHRLPALRLRSPDRRRPLLRRHHRRRHRRPRHPLAGHARSCSARRGAGARLDGAPGVGVAGHSARQRVRRAGAGRAPAPRTPSPLGTYRDLWAGPITELNPPLKFLTPAAARRDLPQPTPSASA